VRGTPVKWLEKTLSCGSEYISMSIDESNIVHSTAHYFAMSSSRHKLKKCSSLRRVTASILLSFLTLSSRVAASLPDRVEQGQVQHVLQPPGLSEVEIQSSESAVHRFVRLQKPLFHWTSLANLSKDLETCPPSWDVSTPRAPSENGCSPRPVTNDSRRGWPCTKCPRTLVVASDNWDSTS
jgi:hypothetical protein